MSIFKRFMAWFRNETKVAQLETKLINLQTKTNEDYAVFHKKVNSLEMDLEEKIKATKKAGENTDHGIDIWTKEFRKEFEKLRERIGKNELMHVEVNKSAQDTYARSMASITAQVSSFSQYALELIERIVSAKYSPVSEQQANLEFGKEDDKADYGEVDAFLDELANAEDDDTPPMFRIKINGEQNTWIGKKIFYDDIVQNVFGPSWEQNNVKYSVFWKDAKKAHSSEIFKGESVSVKDGLEFFVLLR